LLKERLSGVPRELKFDEAIGQNVDIDSCYLNLSAIIKQKEIPISEPE